ncbi:MAG TPA: hypothetical protein VER32_11090 [Pyrinomonadaceae bacterium]|nr:hypothetical protein [Pyrinomonadaceae bacterium]
MDEFEQELSERLAAAQERARTRGRNDVADYLLLRAANDARRAESVAWLVEAFTALAGEANRAGASVGLARDEAHRFRVGNSTMVGTRLVLSSGVRRVTLEAGWPRAPRDGIVRGGGLASARVTHFGDARAGAEFLLVAPADEESAPRWLVLGDDGARDPLSEEHLRRHLTKLLG